MDANQENAMQAKKKEKKKKKMADRKVSGRNWLKKIHTTSPISTLSRTFPPLFETPVPADLVRLFSNQGTPGSCVVFGPSRPP